VTKGANEKEGIAKQAEPGVVVDENVLDSAAGDETVAHEFGHNLNLEHELLDFKNLMHPQIGHRKDELQAEQGTKAKKGWEEKVKYKYKEYRIK